MSTTCRADQQLINSPRYGSVEVDRVMSRESRKVARHGQASLRSVVVIEVVGPGSPRSRPERISSKFRFFVALSAPSNDGGVNCAISAWIVVPSTSMARSIACRHLGSVEHLVGVPTGAVALGGEKAPGMSATGSAGKNEPGRSWWNCQGRRSRTGPEAPKPQASDGPVVLPSP